MPPLVGGGIRSWPPLLMLTPPPPPPPPPPFVEVDDEDEAGDMTAAWDPAGAREQNKRRRKWSKECSSVFGGR